jgi:hypothetical protein
VATGAKLSDVYAVAASWVAVAACVALNKVAPLPTMVTSPVTESIVAEFGFELAKVNAPLRVEVGGAIVKLGLDAV